LSDIEAMLRAFTDDVASARSSRFLFRTIGAVGSESPEILSALNQSPMTWRTILHSLQTTTYVAIGCLFDRDARSVSVHRLLEVCSANPEFFSMSGLLERKVTEGLPRKLATDYVAAAYEPIASDFEDLLPEADKWRNVFVEKYMPVRHKLVAHTDVDHIDQADLLVAQTNVGELEEMLDFAHSVERFVWELAQNGHKYDLGHFDHRDEVWLANEATKLLRSLVPGE